VLIFLATQQRLATDQTTKKIWASVDLCDRTTFTDAMGGGEQFWGPAPTPKKKEALKGIPVGACGEYFWVLFFSAAMRFPMFFPMK
jgi:hypothetical protein